MPSDVLESHRIFLDRFVGWCADQRAVRAVILLGSVAREGAHDALSDLDLMVVTTRLRRFSSARWLDSIDPPPLFTWTYRPPLGGDPVHQAIYQGPVVVDVAPLSKAQALLTGLSIEVVHRLPILRRTMPKVSSQLDTWLSIAARGTEVLLDKDGVAERMLRRASRATSASTLPTEQDFLNTVYSILGLCLWESKQLVRGELWMALGTVDHQVKACLLEMLEWHARVKRRESVETWYGGRKLREWADPRWMDIAPETWPRFDVDAAWSALTRTLDLFSEVATETAEALGYDYPRDRECEVRDWLSDRRRASSPPNP